MASEGPLSAGAGADDAGVGTTAWTDPGNIVSSNDAYATAVDGGSGSTSHYLVASTFGFAIPDGATIDGIVVDWERSGGAGVTDNRIRIVKGGTIGTEEKSVSAEWGAFDQYDTFGSSSDLWGETWTAADINAAGFGATLSATLGSLATGSVDHCRITVYYTASAVQITSGVSAADTANDTPLTTASFTPAAGDLLVATALVTGNGNLTGHAFTDSQGLGWSNVRTVRLNTSADSMTMAVANALTAAAGMTVTFTASGGTGTGIAISVLRVSGMSRVGSDAVRQEASQGNQAAGTPAPVFSASALTTNPTVGAVGNGTNPAGMTAPTSWTEVHDVGYALPDGGLETVGRIAAFTGTTITWGSASATDFGSIIAELDSTFDPMFFPRWCEPDLIRAKQTVVGYF